MAANEKLHKAKSVKNDEFYTQLNDVARELRHYRMHFKGKTVFCNCNDSTKSAFWEYFHLNFGFLGLKKLIATYKEDNGAAYKLEYDGGNDNDAEACERTRLHGDGDFRSEECLRLLEEADIVSTNPPFSLFREYVAQLIEHKKQFIIMGNRNSFGSDGVFNLIMENKMWIGFSSTHHMFFDVPDWYAKQLLADPTRKPGHGQSYSIIDGVVKAEVNACWYTNCDITKRHEKIILWESYDETKFPHYDNYDAIDVSKTAHIPADYDGVMGVPITWLEKYNPEQFKIIGKANFNGAPKINGKNVYTRILIRRI